MLAVRVEGREVVPRVDVATAAAATDAAVAVALCRAV